VQVLSTVLSFVFLCFFFWWDWSLNSGLWACKAGILPLEPQLQSCTVLSRVMFWNFFVFAFLHSGSALKQPHLFLCCWFKKSFLPFILNSITQFRELGKYRKVKKKLQCHCPLKVILFLLSLLFFIYMYMYLYEHVCAHE
jgi:hypothetical protein